MKLRFEKLGAKFFDYLKNEIDDIYIKSPIFKLILKKII